LPAAVIRTIRAAVAHPEFVGRYEVRCSVNDTVMGSSRQTAVSAIRTAGAKLLSFMERTRVEKGESGQSLVEFALVFPVIILVLAGIMMLGIIMNQYQILTYATGQGARAFALAVAQTSFTPTAASDVCEYTYDIATQNMPSLTTSNVTMTITFTPGSQSTKSAQTWSNVNGTSGCSGFSLNGNDINSVVTVQVSYPATSPVFFGVKAMTAALNASATEQVD
jgi:Flp pilus assembly protein TadG